MNSLLFAAPLHVVIDPGHGGIDSGALHEHLKESEIALKVGLILQQKLNSNPQFQVTMTRSSDKNLSLQERVKVAEKAHADLFLSIHLNSNKDPRARGAELYFQNHLPADEETLFLAASENQLLKSTTEDPTKKNDVLAIVEDLERQQRMLSSHRLSVELLKAWDPENHGNVAIRQAPFYVVSKANMPSVLLELGFITNSKEAEKLKTAGYQNEIADKIYQGLLLYKAHVEKAALMPITEKN